MNIQQDALNHLRSDSLIRNRALEDRPDVLEKLDKATEVIVGVLQVLVDKEIPKKPKGKKYNEICPTCHEDSVRTEYASRYEFKRCHECGQVIDWSEYYETK